MDRELTKEEKSRDRRKIIMRVGIGLGIGAAIIAGLVLFSRPSIKRSDIILATVDRGDIASTVSATGKVVPARELMIISPVSARIMELYHSAGDSVDTGTPLMRLDLGSVETEVNKLSDSRRRTALALEQQQLDNRTRIGSLEMEISVKEMSVSRMAVELANERRLDSIGSGTGDRVRQAELAYRTGCIELEQLRSRLDNERRALEAALQSRQLDLSIADKNLAEQQRILEDARIKSPAHATLTFITDQIGRQVSAGEHVATVSDLSSLKIEGEMAESNGRYLSPGGRADIRIARRVYPATIVSVAPVSTRGTVSFSVIPDSQDVDLRPGLSVEVGVVRDMHPDVVRIPQSALYSRGAGTYRVFVEESPGVLTAREVKLGGANYEYIEVVEGLRPGEKVVLGDMESYKASKYIVKD